MESDAEYKALATIIKSDRRQRVFLRLLAAVAFLVVLAFLQNLDGQVKSQVKTVLDQQTKLVVEAQKDGRVRAEENRRYITCLLIVPPGDRDVSSQKFCYDKSDLPGGRTSKEFVPIEINASDAVVATLQSESQATGPGLAKSSSTQSAPKQTATQSDSSQSAAPSDEMATSQSVYIPGVTPLLKYLTRGGLWH